MFLRKTSVPQSRPIVTKSMYQQIFEDETNTCKTFMLELGDHTYVQVVSFAHRSLNRSPAMSVSGQPYDVYKSKAHFVP